MRPYKYSQATVDLVHWFRKKGHSFKDIRVNVRMQLEMDLTLSQIKYILYQRECNRLTQPHERRAKQILLVRKRKKPSSIQTPVKEKPKKILFKKGSFLHYVFYDWFK